MKTQNNKLQELKAKFKGLSPMKKGFVIIFFLTALIMLSQVSKENEQEIHADPDLNHVQQTLTASAPIASEPVGE